MSQSSIDQQAGGAAEESYDKLRQILISNMQTLPPTEMHYYFALLLASIDNEVDNKEKHKALLKQANQVIVKLKEFYDATANLETSDPNSNPKADIGPLVSELKKLIEASNTYSVSHSIKQAILAFCSAIMGFICGVIGAVSGFIGGLFSDYTFVGNFRAAGFGFATGFVIGTLVGARIPGKAFQSGFERKLDFCIDSIIKVSTELKTKKSQKEHQEKVKEYILDTYFPNTPDEEKETVFKEFLEGKGSYAVCTTTAGFVSSSLKGFVGHHFLLLFNINGKVGIPKEYGDRYKVPSHVDQNETLREVTGQKIFDMLVLDSILQETYEYNYDSMSKDYVVGSNDCRTYVDKILIGTNQAPTQMSRFNEQVDKWAGSKMIGPLIRFFSHTKENELESIAKDYEGAEARKTYAKKFIKKEPNNPKDILKADKVEVSREEYVQRFEIAEEGLKKLIDVLLKKENTLPNRVMIAKALNGDYKGENWYLINDDAICAEYFDIAKVDSLSVFYHKNSPKQVGRGDSDLISDLTPLKP